MPPLATPLAIAVALPYLKIHADVKKVVDHLETAALKKLQMSIRDEYYDGLKRKHWRSVNQFAEQMFPDEQSRQARRNLADRLINYEFATRYGPTRETIMCVAEKLGLEEAECYYATKMAAKREATVRIVLPHFHAEWERHHESCPPLPFGPAEPFPSTFDATLTQAGMPAPDQFTTLAGFNNEVEAIARRVPNVPSGDYFWATVWVMTRPFLPRFDHKLMQAAQQAKARNDPRGQRLKDRILKTEAAFRAVRQAARELSMVGNSVPRQVLERASKLLPKHMGDLDEQALTALFAIRHVTVQKICERQVSAGWVVWHDECARTLANDLLLPGRPDSYPDRN